MVRQAFRDPTVFWAYIGAKIGVFAIAAVATWPLAHWIGPRAWIGLGVFGVLLSVLTVAVLFSGSAADLRAADSDGSVSTDEASQSTDLEVAVVIPVEDSLDLHAFSPREVPDVVDAYLEIALENGFSEVRLIHGRGIGVQRDRVQNLLARHPRVSGFHDAPPERGGWGATIAYLKPPKQVSDKNRTAD
jgi:hypothetical protein